MFKTKIDKKNRVHSFEEIGMTDPFRPKASLADAMIQVRNFDFDTKIYKNDIEDKPPTMIFIPNVRLVRRIA